MKNFLTWHILRLVGKFRCLRDWCIRHTVRKADLVALRTKDDAERYLDLRNRALILAWDDDTMTNWVSDYLWVGAHDADDLLNEE